MDYGLVNAFLASQELNENEQMLRDNLVSLNETVQKLTQQRATAAENFQKKEQELLRVAGALENQMLMVVEIARKRGLEPIHLKEEALEEESLSEDS